MVKAGSILSPLSILGVVIPLLGSIIGSFAQESGRPLDSNSSIEQILDRIPDGSTWQSLDNPTRAALEKRALAVLAKDRLEWGPTGLDEKLDLILSEPTDLMAANIDRVLGDTFASELATEFQMTRDVTNPDLRRQLLRIYLTITDSRGYMLSNHPEYRAWDGKPVRELHLIDHEHYRSMSDWNLRTELGLRKIADLSLTDLERAIRNKAYFTTRSGKYFNRPALGLGGAPFYSSLYEKYPFTFRLRSVGCLQCNDIYCIREMNVGTMDAFDFDYDAEFNTDWLKSSKNTGPYCEDIL